MTRKPASRFHRTTIRQQYQDQGTHLWYSMRRSEGTTWIELHGRRQQHEHHLRKHPAKDADPTISMEEVRPRVKRRGTRKNRHIPRSRRARSRLRQPTQLLKACPRVRSTRLAITVPRHIGTASIRVL